MNFTDTLKKTLNYEKPQPSRIMNYSKRKPAMSQNTTPSAATSPIKIIPSIPPERAENKLNSLINNTVKKIKNTPYWSDYTQSEQEKMISKYFDTKIKDEKYSDIKIGFKEKIDFIEDVLARIERL